MADLIQELLDAVDSLQRSSLAIGSSTDLTTLGTSTQGDLVDAIDALQKVTNLLLDHSKSIDSFTSSAQAFIDGTSSAQTGAAVTTAAQNKTACVRSLLLRIMGAHPL